MRTVQALADALETYIPELTNCNFDYKMMVNSLKNFTQIVTPLAPDNNPLNAQLRRMSVKEVVYFIGEYSHISKHAIHMLLDSRIRCYKWPKLRDEIDRNIEEEKGYLTNRTPHLEMMREGYMRDFKIDTDAVPRSQTTEKAMRALKRIFESSNTPFNAGATLAFESIARDEFLILDNAVEQFSKESGHEVHEGNTRKYIDGHKIYEIGHESGLVDSIQPYIDDGNKDDFIKGYAAVLLVMSTWWESVSNDIKFLRVTKT